MITDTLYRLTADAGMILTNGKDFTYSVLLREGESPEDWTEITEVQYHKLQANMTPREFMLAIMTKGVTREQIETLINANDRAWAELNYATVINRANPLLDQMCGQVGLTTADLDEIFGLTI